MTYLVLDAVISSQVCGVELEHHKLEDSAVGPHGLHCHRSV